MEITTVRRRSLQVKRRSPQVSGGHHRSDKVSRGQEEVTTGKKRSPQSEEIVQWSEEVVHRSEKDFTGQRRSPYVRGGLQRSEEEVSLGQRSSPEVKRALQGTEEEFDDFWEAHFLFFFKSVFIFEFAKGTSIKKK